MGACLSLHRVSQEYLTIWNQYKWWETNTDESGAPSKYLEKWHIQIGEIKLHKDDEMAYDAKSTMIFPVESFVAYTYWDSLFAFLTGRALSTWMFLCGIKHSLVQFDPSDMCEDKLKSNETLPAIAMLFLGDTVMRGDIIGAPLRSITPQRVRELEMELSKYDIDAIASNYDEKTEIRTLNASFTSDTLFMHIPLAYDLKQFVKFAVMENQAIAIS